MQNLQTTQVELNQSQPDFEFIDPSISLEGHDFEKVLEELDKWIDEGLDSITLND